MHNRLVLKAAPGFTASYALYGLGGIGKTQIAIEYAYRHKSEFGLVYWLRADDYKTLISNYFQLSTSPRFCDLAGLTFAGEKDHEKIAIRVRKWFESTKLNWLLIFDNADMLDTDDSRSVESLIGKVVTWFTRQAGASVNLDRSMGTLVPRGTTGCVLVTSRNRSVDGEMTNSGDQVLEMTPDDAREFLLKCSRASHDQSEEADKLVDTLGRHPLAIEQAGGYIRSQKLPIAAYRALFDSHKASGLSKGLTAFHQTQYYKETIATTWSMSFKAIEKADPLASKIMRLSAFLDGKGIQRELFAKGLPLLPEHWALSSVNEWDISHSFSVLMSHSLVHPVQESVQMHLLVQQVIRDGLGDDQVRWFNASLQMVESQFSESGDQDQTNSLKYLSQARQCLDHAAKLNIRNSTLTSLLDTLGRYLSATGQNLEAIAYFKRLIDILGEDGSVASIPRTTTEVGFDLGHAYSSMGQYEAARPYYEAALEESHTKYGAEDVRILWPLECLARLDCAQGRYSDAMSHYQEYLKICDQAFGKNHKDSVDVISGMGEVHMLLGEYNEAQSYYERALEIFNREYKGGCIQLTWTIRMIGNINYWLGRYTESLSNFENALKISQRFYPGVFETETSDRIAQVYVSQGRYQEAIALAEKVRSFCEKNSDQHRVVLAWAYRNLGEVYLSMREYEKALFCLQKSSALYIEHLGEGHLWTSKAQSLLGRYFHLTKAYDSAKTYFEMALKAVSNSYFDLFNINFLYTTEMLADFQIDAGQISDAVDTLKRVLDVYTTMIGENNIRSTFAQHYLGRAYAKQQKYDLAITNYAQALSIVETYFEKDHILTAEMMKDLAKAYSAIGRLEEALDLASRAEKSFTIAFGKTNLLAIESGQILTSIEKTMKRQARVA
jgi:tetratricopeptide (TPR) repeat protein